MEEVSLEMSPKNIMIQDMINSENSMNTTESTNTNIFKIVKQIDELLFHLKIVEEMAVIEIYARKTDFYIKLIKFYTI